MRVSIDAPLQVFPDTLSGNDADHGSGRKIRQGFISSHSQHDGEHRGNATINQNVFQLSHPILVAISRHVREFQPFPEASLASSSRC